jgi:hypothetical protein
MKSRRWVALSLGLVAWFVSTSGVSIAQVPVDPRGELEQLAARARAKGLTQIDTFSPQELPTAGYSDMVLNGLTVLVVRSVQSKGVSLEPSAAHPDRIVTWHELSIERTLASGTALPADQCYRVPDGLQGSAGNVLLGELGGTAVVDGVTIKQDIPQFGLVEPTGGRYVVIGHPCPRQGFVLDDPRGSVWQLMGESMTPVSPRREDSSRSPLRRLVQTMPDLSVLATFLSRRAQASSGVPARN